MSLTFNLDTAVTFSIITEQIYKTHLTAKKLFPKDSLQIVRLSHQVF